MEERQYVVTTNLPLWPNLTVESANYHPKKRQQPAHSRLQLGLTSYSHFGGKSFSFSLGARYSKRDM
jgi:hypothetical protein